MTDLELIDLIHKLRPKDKLYTKRLNVDKHGNKITRGTLVNFEMYNITNKVVVLLWNHLYGWYYMDSVDQAFLMPTRFYADKNIQVFHYCEVLVEVNKVIDDIVNMDN